MSEASITSTSQITIVALGTETKELTGDILEIEPINPEGAKYALYFTSLHIPALSTGYYLIDDLETVNTQRVGAVLSTKKKVSESGSPVTISNEFVTGKYV